MKHIVLAIAIYWALAADAACGAALSIGDHRLPVVWLLVVLALSWFADARGIAWAAVIGLLADGMMDEPFGLSMCSTTLTAAMLVALKPDAKARSLWLDVIWQFSVLATGLFLTRGIGSMFAGGHFMTLVSLTHIAAEAGFGATLCLMLGLLRAPFAPTPRNATALRF